MSTPQKSDFSELLFKKIIPRVQLIALAVSIIGLFFYFQNLAGAQDMLMTGLSTLAGTLFLSAFAMVPVSPESKHNPIAFILYKVLYISAAVIVIGILFYVLKLNGYKEMLLIGCMALGADILFSAALIGTNPDNMAILKRPFLIGIPLLLVGGYFLYQLESIF